MATTTSELELIISANAAQFKGELAKVQGQLDGLSASAKKADGFFSGFKSALPDISKMALGLGAASVAFSALSNAIGGVLAKETSLAEFSAITGVVGDSLATFGDAAVDLSNKFGGDAVSQIESFKGVLSRLGPDFASSSDAVRMMGDSINTLAKAGGIDATQAMDALTTSMLQFGVDLSDPNEAATKAAEMMNVLAAGAQAGAAEIPQVSEAIKAAGVAASGANVSFEETNAAIQVLAAGGKVGSEAGISLRNVLGSLVTQSKEGETALAKMGLSSSQLGKVLTTQGLNAALELLSGNLNKVGGEDKQLATLMALFGKENAAAAGILIKGAAAADGQTSALKRMTQAVTGTNSAYEQADTVMNPTAAKLERLSAVMSNALQAALSGLVDVGAFLLDGLSSISDVLSVLAPMIGAGAAAFGLYSLAVNASAIAHAVYTAAVNIASSATASFLKGLLTNPVFLMAAGITGMVLALKAYNDENYNYAVGQKTALSVDQKKLELQVKNTEQQAKHKEEMIGLFVVYEELGKKTTRTAEESKKFNAAQLAIAKEYPGLIKGGADFSTNLAAVKAEAERAKGSLAELSGTMAALNKQQRMMAMRQAALDVDVAEQKLGALIAKNQTFLVDLTGSQAAAGLARARTWLSLVRDATDEESLMRAQLSAYTLITNATDIDAAQKKEYIGIIDEAVKAQQKLLVSTGELRIEQEKPVKVPPPGGGGTDTGGGTPTGTKSKEKDDGYKQQDALLQHTAELDKIRLENTRFNAKQIEAIEDKLLADRIALAEKFKDHGDELSALRFQAEVRTANKLIETDRKAFAKMALDWGLAINDMNKFPDPFEKLKKSAKSFSDMLRGIGTEGDKLGPILVGVFDNISKAAAEGSAAAKAAASVSALINTYGAANAAYRSAAEIPVVGWLLAPIAAAAAVAAGLANVARINSLAVGTPFVAQDQLANIHQGEMIVPRTFAEGVRSGDVVIGGDKKKSPSERIRRERGQRIEVDTRMRSDVFKSTRRRQAYYDNARAF